MNIGKWGCLEKLLPAQKKADPGQLQGQRMAEAICLEKRVSTCWHDFLQP